MAEKKKKLPISVFELVVYILAGLMALWGITYVVLGVVAANFASYKSSLYIVDAALKDNTSGLGFLGQGLIVLAVAVVVAAFVLLSNAKKSDREYEKEQRRSAARNMRQAARKQAVVDAEAEPVNPAQ